MGVIVIFSMIYQTMEYRLLLMDNESEKEGLVFFLLIAEIERRREPQQVHPLNRTRHEQDEFSPLALEAIHFVTNNWILGGEQNNMQQKLHINTPTES